MRQVVSLVAIGATRPALGLLGRCRLTGRRRKAPAVNAVLQPLLDKSMASCAGCSHGPRIECRARIGRGVNSVVAVAVGANGGHHQSRLLKTVSVDADQVRLGGLRVAPAADLYQ